MRENQKNVDHELDQKVEQDQEIDIDTGVREVDRQKVAPTRKVINQEITIDTESAQVDEQFLFLCN